MGDLPHGEDPALDDSAWQTVTPGSEAPYTEAGWYRAWIEVPKDLQGYDISGSRILFHFRFYGDVLAPTIVYFNGRRVAMGESLEPVVLFDDAKPGEKILVAVKAPPTAIAKHYLSNPMKIEVAATRPSPGDLREEFISASALLGGADDAESVSERKKLEQAIAAVDLEALSRDDQVAFDKSLREAQAQLEPLRPFVQKFTFHLTGNSHMDAAWLWPWTETVDTVRRTFGTATQLMQEYPDYTFTQSTAQQTEWISQKYPDINDEIRKRVKEGRWEIVGGMWVEPDLNMPDGESLVRQLLVGNEIFKAQYGVEARVGWNPDSFGYNWQLPQIYKKSGINYFVTSKLSSNDTHKLPFILFWWESPDGSKILTYLPRRYNSTDLSPARLSSELAPLRGATPGLQELMDLYGVGDHGGGATRAILDEGKHWSETGIVPRMQFGTALSYFTDVERNLDEHSQVWNYESIAKGFVPPPLPADGKVAIPTWKDELYYENHRGTTTTQAQQKRNMRESEEWVLNSEKYASLAWLRGDTYPSTELTEAWKKVLFNQFHDLAAGSGIGVIYKDAQKDYDQVRWAAHEVSAKALHTISSDIDTRASAGVPILVFNPLAWKRSGVVAVDVQMPDSQSQGVSVLDSQNRVVASTILSADHKRNTYKLLVDVQDVPSMGYKVLHVAPGIRPFATDLKVNGLTLENAALRVTVDRETGCITSLYDKKSNFESLAQNGCGNQLQTFADNPKSNDAWNIDPGTFDHVNAIAKADSVVLVENDQMRATIRVTRNWQSSKFVQDIILYAGADQIDIVNDIDWHERHVLIKAAFPLAAASGNATYEIPYGTIERPTTRNNSWEQTRFEVSALRWADLGDGQHGFSLINEAKYGYDAKDSVLRLTLLRSPTWPDPEADQGHQHFSYSLYPHAGDWKQALTERRGYEYNYKLTAMQVQAHAGSLPQEYSFVTVKPENVVLTAVKKAEDSDGLIFRVFEWAGESSEVSISVPHGATSATVTNLMEKPEDSAVRLVTDAVTVPIHPYEILSVRVDYAKP